MEVDSWLTGKRGISLPFTDECATLTLNEKNAKRIRDKALELAKNRNWKYIEFREGENDDDQEKASIRYFSHTLALEKDTSALFNRCSSSARRAIRKSERSGVEVSRSESLEILKSFYALLCLTRKRHGLPPQPWLFFENIHKSILSQNKGSVFLATRGAEPIAGALFLGQNQNAIYKFGASNEEHQAARPNNLVMWKAIEWHALNGFGKLHFGRTSIGNSGLRRFKQSWGTEEQILPYYRHNTKTQAIESLHDQTSGWHTRIFQRLPGFLSREIGKLLYKHVA